MDGTAMCDGRSAGEAGPRAVWRTRAAFGADRGPHC